MVCLSGVVTSRVSPSVIDVTRPERGAALATNEAASTAAPVRNQHRLGDTSHSIRLAPPLTDRPLLQQLRHNDRSPTARNATRRRVPQ